MDMSRFLDRFVNEIRDKLGLLDETLAVLEKNPDSDASGFNDAVAEAMRLAHSIKGSARMMGYNHINKLSHSLEDLLIAVRSRGRASRDALEAILRSREGIDRLLSLDPQKLKETGSEPDWLQDIIQLLHDISLNDSERQTPGDETSSRRESHSEDQGDDESEAAYLYPNIRSVRVDVGGLDAMLQESRRIRRRLAALTRGYTELRGIVSQPPEAKRILDGFEHMLADLVNYTERLEDTAVRMRMRPINDLFELLPDQLNELAASLGKGVNLDFTGGDVKLDSRTVDLLGEVLIHIMRNAVDHGIEPPEEREKAGKNRDGWIWVSVRENAGWARITIADDGRGIDLQAVWERARELGLTDTTEPPPERLREGFRFLFDDRFTSRREASEVSGRGVGLATVRRRLRELRGEVEIESEPGIMMRIILTMPTSLSRQKILVVSTAWNHNRRLLMGIPVAMVQSVEPGGMEETDTSVEESLHTGFGTPAISLKSYLHDPYDEARAKEPHLVVVSDGVRTASIGVDDIVDNAEAIIEPLPTVAQSPLIAGVSSLPGAEIILILNVPALLGTIYARAAGRMKA